MLAKFGQQVTGFSPPELQEVVGSQSRQRLLVTPLQTDPLISMAMQRLKLPFTAHVGFKVGAFVGCLVGSSFVGRTVGDGVGSSDGWLVG